eukprot:scaffold7104_cov302-Pinguiococcus_pyrenoidosus.AAC.2
MLREPQLHAVCAFGCSDGCVHFCAAFEAAIQSKADSTETGTAGEGNYVGEARRTRSRETATITLQSYDTYHRA